MKCKKNANELPDFDENVVGKKNIKLVKTFRSMYEGEIPEKYQVIIDEMSSLVYELKPGETERLLIQKYGEEDYNQSCFVDQLSNTVSASWECKDCIIK
jgi:hypothetical protein